MELLSQRVNEKYLQLKNKTLVRPAIISRTQSVSAAQPIKFQMILNLKSSIIQKNNKNLISLDHKNIKSIIIQLKMNQLSIRNLFIYVKPARIGKS